MKTENTLKVLEMPNYADSVKINLNYCIGSLKSYISNTCSYLHPPPPLLRGVLQDAESEFSIYSTTNSISQCAGHCTVRI